jgi:L-lactate dehydrogenase complex protein LldF
MGMEKVIPDLPAFAAFMRILARSATGQKMGSYVSVITGPRRRDEEDGPEAFHLVVLDNGRSRLLADRVLRESLFCIRCGACLNACPVYRHAGGHAFGWVYSGPIGSVITPSYVGHDKARELPFASTLCGACRDVCPVRINIPHLLLEQRRKVVTKAIEKPNRLIRWFSFINGSGTAYRWASRLAYWLSRPLARGGLMKSVPTLASWTRARDFPAPARQSFRDWWKKHHG